MKIEEIKQKLDEARAKAIEESKALAEQHTKEFTDAKRPLSLASLLSYTTEEAINVSSKYTNEVLLEILSKFKVDGGEF